MRHTTLNLLYPPFRCKLLAALTEAREAGIPFQIFETFRTRERQSILFAQGRTAPGRIITRARAGRSFHQYGIAQTWCFGLMVNGHGMRLTYIARLAPYLKSMACFG